MLQSLFNVKKKNLEKVQVKVYILIASSYISIAMITMIYIIFTTYIVSNKLLVTLLKYNFKHFQCYVPKLMPPGSSCVATYCQQNQP